MKRKRWALAHMGLRKGCQKAAKLLAPEPCELGLALFKPRYTGKVLLRKKGLANG